MRRDIGRRRARRARAGDSDRQMLPGRFRRVRGPLRPARFSTQAGGSRPLSWPYPIPPQFPPTRHDTTTSIAAGSSRPGSSGATARASHEVSSSAAPQLASQSGRLQSPAAESAANGRRQGAARTGEFPAAIGGARRQEISDVRRRDKENKERSREQQLERLAGGRREERVALAAPARGMNVLVSARPAAVAKAGLDAIQIRPRPASVVVPGFCRPSTVSQLVVRRSQ
jgi:hypothetical protein